MNFAHLHLLLNHIPVVGMPLVIIFLIYGLATKNFSLQRFSLFLLFGLAMLVLPIYFTGEPAESRIEELPGFSEAFIAPHEDAALFSLVITVICGVLAAVTLIFQNNDSKFNLLKKIVLVIGLLAVGSLFYTANLGGKVRHTELRADSEESATTK